LLNVACFGQEKCLLFKVGLFDKSGQPIVNTVLHQAELNSLGFEICYFNCGGGDFIYYPKTILAADFKNTNDFDNMHDSHVFAKLYRKDEKGEHKYFGYSNIDQFGGTRFDLNDDRMAILKPKCEFVAHGTTNYLKYLPIGEYYIYFYFVDNYNVDSDIKNDYKSLMKSMCYNGKVDINSGYYEQMSAGAIHIMVVE
jgi:hypothetical protein